MKKRVARGDIRGILFETQHDVNILLYIELEKQSESSFPWRNKRGIISSALSEIPSSFNEARWGKGERTSKDGDAVINVITKRDQ